MIQLWNRFKNSSTIIKITLIALSATWSIVFALFIVGLILLRGSSSQAQLPDTEQTFPAIELEPAAGMVSTPVIVHGQGWSPQSVVRLYLAAPNEFDTSNYAVADAEVDSEGQFTVMIIIPADSRWEDAESVKIIARAVEGQATTQALFTLINLSDLPIDLPTETPSIQPEPTITPTTVIQEPAEPTSTPQPGSPLVTSLTDLNVRGGPGTNYAILGLLKNGQSAEPTGISPDGNWWQIKFSGVTNERGWVSAKYTEIQNTGNVPVVQPPVQQPAPQPVPITITDWRGEYYNNINLSGTPKVVRNDVSINFDWGGSAPAAGIDADNFSVRWTRKMSFPSGTYRFYARVDDGVRLWVDDVLVIDRWHDTNPTTYTADVTLSDGFHTLRLEYYERSGTAIAQLAWEWLEAYPDWKGEYFNNPNLSGKPVLVRNDPVLQFSWGPNAPGPGVPADNFSARWSRDLYFSAGTYRFKVLVDDGARLWIDGNLLIDQWRMGDPRTFTAEITLTEGFHNFRLEYFDYRYDAQVRLDWERLSSNYPDWKAEYFNNRKLEGNPILVRNEAQINYNWGGGSPAAGIPADNFSARWTRKASFQSGTYLFRVKVDDGVRVWFDDALIIDSWQDGGVRTLEAQRQVSEGQHRLRVEYYERSGDARIELSWQKKETPANQPPQTNPGGPYTVDEGSQVTFDGRGSKDADGSIATYEWDFDYKDGVFTAEGSGSTGSRRYDDGPATVMVALRVTDNKGLSNVAVTQVTVKNVAPSVEAGGPYAGQVGKPIVLSGTATDPGLIDQTGLSYRWEFGDGNLRNGPVVSHSYAQAGTYNVKLTVTDKDGAQGNSTATVQVSKVNQPPQAAIDGPTSGLVGQNLSFNGGNSTDPDGTIVRYIWDFGNGSTGNGVNVSHSYGAAGSYNVTLTVIDNDGLSANKTQSVQITAPAPVNLPPIAAISGPTSGVISETLTFSGSNSTDPENGPLTYVWDFDDGSAPVNGMDVTYSYSLPGSYTVTLTVTDNGGLSNTTTSTVVIN